MVSTKELGDREGLIFVNSYSAVNAAETVVVAAEGVVNNTADTAGEVGEFTKHFSLILQDDISG